MNIGYQTNKSGITIILIYASLLFPGYFCMAQDSLTLKNLGFEMATASGQLPPGWMRWGSAEYIIRTDTSEKHRGRNSVLIEKVTPPVKQNFGCIVSGIPAEYPGKTITLKAWMKFEDASHPIGLLLRIDGKGSPLEFENMQEKGLRGSSGWKQYSVKLPYPAEAREIYFGALLMGTGKLWLDDFEVLVDGKNIKGLKKNTPVKSKAEEDKEFDTCSGIKGIQLTDIAEENLVILGKIWGFLKYYHPLIAQGEYNWDYELFRILPKILRCQNSSQRNTVLSVWIRKYGEIKKTKQVLPQRIQIKMSPDLLWINDPNLGDSLRSQLETIADAGRKPDHYYISLTPGIGNPVFKNEEGYNTMKYPDAGFRLLCLYRYWNIIHYFYPYKYAIGENWNEVLKENIRLFLNAKDELEYQLAALALIARIKDTHANIWNPSDTLTGYKGRNYAPAELAFIEDKAVVTGFSDSIPGIRPSLELGDIIETVNGIPIGEFLKNRLPYTPASNFPTQLRNLASEILRTNDSTILVSVLRKGIREKIRLACYPPSQMNIFRNRPVKDTCFRLLTPELAYLYAGTLKNEYLPGLIPLISKTKGLIIDLRCYPADFIVFSLGNYLVPGKVKFVTASIPSITSPGLFCFDEGPSVGAKHRNYKGQVIILVNEQTQSQAEFTAMAFRCALGALVMGSTTAGADGDVSQIILPGGIMTMISGIGIYYPDGRETQRVGILPDVDAYPSIEGVRTKRDEVLEKAISLLQSKRISR